MGYIKKLKNNELVGGTDKTTIYPVTSTEAVFEEITNGNESSFKSQKTINKEQQDELDDHEERIQAAEAEDIKSITINGSTKKFEVDDKNNVDLTIYTIDSDPDMPGIADSVRDLRNMVGTSTPVLGTSHKARIETLEGGESVTGSVENKIKTKIDTINSSFQDEDNEYVKYSMTQTSSMVTDFSIDESSLRNAITSLNSSISGDNIVIRSGSTPSGTGEAGKIYRYVNSSNNTYTDYMYSGGSWVTLAVHDTSDEQAQVAYYTCITSGSGAQAVKQFISSGTLTYTPSSGGHIKILMGERNTATGTIYLQYNTDATNTKKPLYYNGEPVSATNTWDAGEVIAVYYDTTNNRYQASNAQGGSNKKINEYLYGDVKALAVGTIYKKDEAVKTTDKQFRRMTKEVGTMNLTDEVAVGDLKVNSGITYRAASAISTFNPSTTYSSGAYALGSFSEYTLTVTSGNAAGNITINGTRIAIIEGETAVDIAAAIASGVTIDGWTLTANGDGTVTVRCNTIGANNTTISFTDTDTTGVTISGNTVPSATGTNTIRKYDGSSWSDATTAGMVTDGVFTDTVDNVAIDEAWLIENATAQNSVTQDIDKLSQNVAENLYASKVWATSNNNAIRNGSVGNTGNPICVAVTKIIDVSDLKRIKLVTNRPNSENCVYRWVYTTFSITSGNSNSQTNRIRQFDGYNNINYPSEFGLQEQEVGLAFGVLEWNTVTNTASALRVRNFSGYVIGFEGVKKEPKYDYPVLQEGTSLTLDVSKMDIGSLQASGIIATVYSENFTTFPIEVSGIQSITITKPSLTINGQTFDASLRIVEFDSVECKNGVMIYNSTPSSNYTFTPQKKYVKIRVGWYQSGFDMLTIMSSFSGLKLSSSVKMKVIDLPIRQLPVFPCKDIVYQPCSGVRLGSVGNIGNAYSIATSYVMPTYGHKYAMIYTSYKPQDGCVLKFTSIGLTVDNGQSEVASNVAENRVFYGDYGIGGNNIISDVSDAIGIAFSVVEYNLSTGTYTGRDTLLSALNEEHFGIILFDEHTSIAPYLDKDAILNASVTELNGVNNVKNLLAQATRYPRVGQTQKTKPLTLLHFSDMHGSAAALRRIIAFKNEWTSYIDDIIDTGDTIYLRYSNDWTWFTAIEGSENILMAIGNHDALAATRGWDWTNLITSQQGYERYMAGIKNWGVTYQVNKTYYYKDYSTEKIRLIVLDCMLWDSTQLEWLTNTLASAKTAGLAVVCVSHYPPLMDGLDNCSFNSPRETNDYVNSDALIAVDNFMQNDGHFICWVCGHVHNDKFGTVQNYPNQTVVVVDTCATDADNLAYSDIARVDRTKSQDLFNIISFDTWNKRIKLVRIGADYDFMMRHKGTLCWDYDNQKLLWNT